MLGRKKRGIPPRQPGVWELVCEDCGVLYDVRNGFGLCRSCRGEDAPPATRPPATPLKVLPRRG